MTNPTHLNRRACLAWSGYIVGGLWPQHALADASAQTSQAPAGLARRLQQRAADAEAFGFSGQIIAMKGREILLDRAYGWADRQAGRRLIRHTPIGIASLSKQFSAAAIMALQEAGILSVDDPIGRFLPDAPADKGALTLHQILTHTSGLPGGDLSRDFELDKTGVLRSVYAARLRDPGPWRYSNAGYNLIAAVIEAASGVAYEDFLCERIFGPAGMADTGFEGHVSLRGRRPAHAYRGWLDKGSPDTWPRPNYRSWGGGTIFSTASDILRWQTALEGGRVLKRESVGAMVAQHVRPQLDNVSVGYGYGAFTETTATGRFIERSGDWELGYNSAWHRWPEEDLTLIVVSNGTTGSGTSMRQMVQRDLELIMRGQEPPSQVAPRGPLPSHTRLQLAGSYPTEDGQVRLIDDGANLWAVAEGQSAVQLLLPREPEIADTMRLVALRTQALFDGLRDHRADAAFDEALVGATPEVRQDYKAEWADLIARHGPLQSIQNMGAVPRGEIARALVQLNFASGTELMELFWGDRGTGRLRGTALSDALLPALVGLVLAPMRSGAGLASVSREVLKVSDDRRLVFDSADPLVRLAKVDEGRL